MEAFGAEDSRVRLRRKDDHHAVVRIGDSMIEWAGSRDAQPMPPALFMNVENLEQRVISARLLQGRLLYSHRKTRIRPHGWVERRLGNVWYLTAIRVNRTRGEGVRGKG